MFRKSGGDRSRRLGTLVLATAAACLLSACAGSVPQAGETNGSPTPPSAVATPTPTPAPIVSTIVMSGSQLVSKTDSGASVETVDFAEGTDAAVAFLTAALGTAPKHVPTSDIQACSDVTARYAWGGDAAVLDVWEPAGFVVTFREPSFNGVALLSSGDFAVGDNAQAFFDGLPPEQALDEYNDSSGPFVYDQVAAVAPWGEDNGYGGVASLKPGGVVSAIVAPDTTRAFYC